MVGNAARLERELPAVKRTKSGGSGVVKLKGTHNGGAPSVVIWCGIGAMTGRSSTGVQLRLAFPCASPPEPSATETNTPEEPLALAAGVTRTTRSLPVPSMTTLPAGSNRLSTGVAVTRKAPAGVSASLTTNRSMIGVSSRAVSSLAALRISNCGGRLAAPAGKDPASRARVPVRALQRHQADGK